MLPVPLNSSKITSSMRRAGVDEGGGHDGERAALLDVAGGARRTARGRWSALASRPPESTLPDDGMTALWARAKRVMRVEQDHHVALVLDQALGLLDHHVRHLHVARGGLVEGGGDHLALHRALHVGDFFRAARR